LNSFQKGETPWGGFSNPEVIEALVMKKKNMPLPKNFQPQLIVDLMNECWKEKIHTKDHLLM